MNRQIDRSIDGYNPIPVELSTLVNIDDPVGGRFPVPDGIVQEPLDPG